MLNSELLSFPTAGQIKPLEWAFDWQGLIRLIKLGSNIGALEDSQVKDINVSGFLD